MRNNCPNCGATLPLVADGFCPECRSPLDESPIEDLIPRADTNNDDLSNIAQERMAYCTQCNGEIAQTEMICPHCGYDFSDQEPLISEVLAQLNQSDATGRSWMHSILVLGMTLILFSVAGLFSFGLAELLLIVVVLLVHESGHYLGMRLFNYQNVRMFFIPFFGAAVSGHKTGISAFKEAIVILLGPLPGIAVGIVLSVVAMQRSDKLLVDASQMFVIINAFNLLPFLPLDGGRLLHLVLFSRQRHIEAVFQLVAGAALAILGWSLGAWLLAVLGGLMVLGTAASFQISSIAQELRAKTAIDPIREDARTTVPREVVVRIIEKLGETDSKAVAAKVRDVWERIHAQPPGIFASLLLLSIYGAGLAAPFLAGTFWFLTFIPDWVEVSSKEGDFVVTMPGTPEKREEKERILLFWSITNHQFTFEKSNNSGAYLVSYGDLPKLLMIGSDPDEILDGFFASGAAANNAKTVSVQNISLQGYPGKELSYEFAENGATVSGITRWYLVNERVYVVQVVGWKGTLSPKNVQKFFHSFRLLDK